MPLVSRTQWGARPPRPGAATSMVAHPSITVHWEGEGWHYPWDHSTCDDKVRGIQNFHMDGRGWSDIAYNYLNCPHGYTYEGRGYNKRSSANGNDTWNMASYATQAMWGSNAGAKVPNALKDALLFSFEILRSRGTATSVVKGHRDWHSTDCPGDELYAWVKAGCPDPTPPIIFEDDQVLSSGALTQIATTVGAVLEQEVQDGQSLHELVQRFSAFNAENTRQNVDQAQEDIADVDEAVDLVLKDDFANINQKVNQLAENQQSMQQTLTQILAKLNATS